MRREMRLYFAFFAITYLGSCLSAIATFIQIDRVFGSISYLGVALSLKTLFLVLGGLLAPRVILSLGLRRTLAISQWAGVFFLGALCVGFHWKNFPLVLVGIFTSSLPSLILTVVCSSLYRLSSKEPEDFRRLQGTQALLGGLCFLLAGTATPYLMGFLSFDVILALDAATYVVGAAFLSVGISGWIELIDRDEARPAASAQPDAAEDASVSWSDPRILEFAAMLGSTYLLIGLVPLVSISRQSLWSDVLRDVPQGLFWSIEAGATLISGWLYRSASRSAPLQKALALPIPVGLFLIPLVFSSTSLGVAASLAALSLTMALRFLKVRDDFMLQFESKAETVRASARVSMVVHFLMFASPLILLPFIRRESQALLLITVSLGAQALLIVLGVLIHADRARAKARKSLNEILLRLTSFGLIGLGLSLSAVLIAVLYFSMALIYQRQAATWAESFPRSAIPHLIDSDYMPLDGKVRLLQKTGIFKTFAVRDKSGEMISHFGTEPRGRGLTGPLVTIPIRDEAGVEWGSFEFRVDHSVYFRPFLAVSLIATVLTLLATVLFRWLLRRQLKSEFDSFSVFLKEIEALASAVSTAVSSNEKIRVTPRTGHQESIEAAQINDVVSALTGRIEEYQRSMSRIEFEKRRSEIVAEIARQVAHDIRSPLAALDIATSDMSEFPEDKRILLRTAIGRIRDIANSLVDRHRSVQQDASADGAASHLLCTLIDPVISEKRLQLDPDKDVFLELRQDSSVYGLFARVQPAEFMRMTSNLIGNAVEAMEGRSGPVTVVVSRRDGEIAMSVRDEGKGIPPEILSRLGRRGETHGKTGGSGLGLHHARACAEAWGGRLDIKSELDRGTTVTVTLPSAPAPEWFVPELVAIPGSPVVVLDDDESIHRVWQGQWGALKASARGVEIVHAAKPRELREWVLADSSRARRALFLLDYELAGHAETGLSLAEELGIGERSVLVTSRHEEPAILEGCARLRARMIPKSLAGFVPIRILQPTDPPIPPCDAVLIDDDQLTRMTWQMAASRLGKSLRAFSSPAEFFSATGGIARSTPVYIDAELGDGLSGADESKRIRALGFTEIYLATGHPAHRFSGLDHLRGVVGKSPPWA